jgi:hypothetical protein
VALARDHGITTVFVPAVDAHEAALVDGWRFDVCSGPHWIHAINM